MPNRLHDPEGWKHCQVLDYMCHFDVLLKIMNTIFFSIFKLRFFFNWQLILAYTVQPDSSVENKLLGMFLQYVQK
jgi:hypothetical protein